MKEKKSRKIAIRGMLVALAMLLSFLESKIPFPGMAPGMKIGITNIVVLVALYKIGPADAFYINIIRVILTGFTFGSLMSLAYGLAGGMLSFLTMFGLYLTKKISPPVVSMVGGVMHNLGQIGIAIIFLNTTKLIYYLPILWVGGMISGAVVGVMGAIIIKRL